MTPARRSVESDALKPPLKWAGGKRWQVPLLKPLWQPHRHRRLVEPFCGGLAVALGLGPERALLNDRIHVSTGDIRSVALGALRHRVLLNFEGEAEQVNADTIVEELLAATRADG